jgi:NTE family protein
MWRSTTALLDTATAQAYPPDLLIKVPRNACRSLEFCRADEVIHIGQELAAAAADTLEELPGASLAGP